MQRDSLISRPKLIIAIFSAVTAGGPILEAWSRRGHGEIVSDDYIEFVILPLRPDFRSVGISPSTY